MGKSKKKVESYNDWAHRFGRNGALIAIIYMLLIPTIISAVYDIFPPISAVLKGSIGVLAMFIPVGISEVLSFTPILGSSSYLSFLTGNLMNLKIPCSVNAMKLAKVEQNTPEGEAISAIAVAVSSILTMIVIALGVVLIVPLRPLLLHPTVQSATKYMLSALFGGMLLGSLGKGDGEYIIERKLLVIVIPVILVVIAFKAGILMSGLEGIGIIAMIPVTLLCARIMWKKGIVKVVKNPNKINKENEMSID